MTWVAVGTAVAGALISGYGADRAAKKQDQTAAAGIRQQAENKRKIAERTNMLLDKTKGSNADDEVEANNSNYLSQIQRSMLQARGGLQPQGVSEDYDQLATQSIGSAGDYAREVAGLMARIDGGVQQRQGEANSFGNMGMDLEVLGQEVQGDQFLNNLRLQGIRKNPLYDIAGGALSGYGKGYASRGGGGG